MLHNSPHSGQHQGERARAPPICFGCARSPLKGKRKMKSKPDKGKLPSLREAVARLKLKDAFLYYPGSGFDMHPLKLFGNMTGISTVVYVDYILKEVLISRLIKTPFSFTFTPLELPQFGKGNWSDFWPERSCSDRNQVREPKGACGYQVILPKGYIKNDDLKFYYLGTEGCATYIPIAQTLQTTAILVLQDHGTGCNWTYFGAQGHYFYETAISNLPKYILAAHNTGIWKGYEQISEFSNCPKAGGVLERKNKRRALFELVNPPSPEDIEKISRRASRTRM
jgi:hypothetical protein